MANQSKCSMLLDGSAHSILELKTQIEKYGFDFGITKMPTVFSIYSAEPKIVSKEEWGRLNAQKKLRRKPLEYIKESLQMKLVSKYGAANWYDWRFENWGTKYNTLKDELIRLEIEDLPEGRQRLVADYLGAWCGGYKWFVTVCAYYRLSGKFVDMDMSSDFFHSIIMQDGEIIETHQAAYD